MGGERHEAVALAEVEAGVALRRAPLQQGRSGGHTGPLPLCPFLSRAVGGSPGPRGRLAAQNLCSPVTGLTKSRV